MVTIEDIEYAFETYFSNFINSISLDEKLLEPASKEEWIRRLLDCANFQQGICDENLHIVNKFKFLFLEHTEELTAAHYDVILKYCRKLYYAQYSEPVVLLNLAQKLIPHYEHSEATEDLLFLYTCAGYAASQLARTDQGDVVRLVAFYYKKVLSFRNDIERFKNPLSRDYIFIAYNNLIRIAPRLGSITVEEAYSFWQELYSIRTRNKFCQFDECNPRIPNICEKALDGLLVIDCTAELLGHTFPEDIHQLCVEMSKKRYSEVMAQADSIYHCPASIIFHYYKTLAEEGTLSLDEAWTILDDYYFRKRELISEESEFDYLTFHIDCVLLLLGFLQKSSYSIEKKKKKYAEYRLILGDFLTKQQPISQGYTISDGLRFATFHPLFLDTFDNPVEKINFIIDSVVSRHLSTFTHSVMVSYLAEAFLKRIFLYCPEFLIPKNSGTTVEAVLSHQAEVMDYTIQSALLHDIGKNGIIPVITTQHRKLTDYEFQLIKMHPGKGAEYLSTSIHFARFQDIALGHHKSYDGKRGYPMDFDNVHSKYRPIIDLIHICDCLDAATDYLSRNYHRAKSFETVMQEFINGKGTEYNPVLIDLILEHTDLYEELTMLTEHNRENIYYDVYLTFVNKHTTNMEHLNRAPQDAH